MRRLVAILLSVVLFGSARAQSRSWAPINGQADSYPTARAAVESMADTFAKKLRSSGFKQTDVRVIVTELPEGHASTSGSAGMGSSSGSMSVTSGPDITKQARAGAVPILIARLQRDLPGSKIVAADKAIETGEHDATIGIGMDDVESIERSGVICVNGYQGRLRATLSYGDLQDVFGAEFVNMPWVNEWASFIQAQPNRNWIVGKSDSACASEDAANASACEDAAAQFVRIAHGKVRMGNAPVPFDALKQMIANQLRINGATERFVQQINTENGSNWRVAVLVSSNDQSLRTLLPSVATLESSGSSSVSRTWFSFASILAMVLVIAVLYLFLKGATAGRFNVRLRIGAAAFLLIAAALLLLGSLFFVGVRYEPSAMPARAEIHKP